MNDDVWRKCRNQIRNEIPADEDLRWINPLKGIVEDNRLVLLAHNQYTARTVRANYAERFRELAQQYADPDHPLDDVIVRLDVIETVNPVPLRADQHKSKREEKFENTGLNKKFTFDDFIEGTSNEFAKSAAFNVAQAPGSEFNPLLLHGDVGLGKTHLMQAIGNYIYDVDRSKQVRCLYSTHFFENLVTAIQDQKVEQFKDTYRRVDVLLMDDVHFFVGKDKSQEEFFHLFNELENNGCQMVFTCDRYPTSLRLEKRLSSRFVSGFTTELKPPDLETRAAILLRKAHQDKIELSEHVALHIAERVRSNVRELEGTWRTIKLGARSNEDRITIDYVDQALDTFINYRRPKLDPRTIMKEVADYFNIHVSVLSMKDRSFAIAYARHMAMTLIRENTTLPLKTIGKYFGNKDHSSVKHAHSRISELRTTSDDVKQDYENLKRKLVL